MAPSSASLRRLLLLGFSLAATLAGGTPAMPGLPERLDISYHLRSSLTDGVARFSWKREGSHYTLDSSIEASGLFALIGALRQSSRGEVTSKGLQPAFFSIKRGDGVADTASFNRDSNELKVVARGENREMPLPPRLQDTLSFLFQLGYDLPAAANASDRLSVTVTNARKVYRHEFQRAGEETLQTPMGPIKTVHLKSNETNPEDVYEVWLATENAYLPVKLKFFAGRFLIEQTVASISTDGR